MVAVHLGDKVQDIVDVDLHLLDQFHLEDDVIVHVYHISALVLPVLVVQINVHTVIVLLVTSCQDFHPFKLVKGGEYISSSKYGAVELDEILFPLLANDGLPNRELLRQRLDKFGVTRLMFALIILIAIVILLEGLQEHQAAGLLVAKPSDRGVSGLFKVAEAYDVAESLHAVQYAVRATVRLY